jgi:hypothetical protein
MNDTEESVHFYHALGEALNAWSGIEQELCSIGVYSDGGPYFREVFYAVDNFRSKLAIIDAIVTKDAPSEAVLARWQRVRDRIAGLSTTRNKLAHYPMICYSNHKVIGRRCALVPPLSDRTAHLKKPPPNSLCLRDIVIFTFEVGAVCRTTQNLIGFYLDAKYRRSKGLAPLQEHELQGPFQESSEQLHSWTGIRAIRDRTRVMLGVPRLPSRQSQSKKP